MHRHVSNRSDAPHEKLHIKNCSYESIWFQRWVYPNPNGWGAATTVALAAIANGNLF